MSLSPLHLYQKTNVFPILLCKCFLYGLIYNLVGLVRYHGDQNKSSSNLVSECQRFTDTHHGQEKATRTIHLHAMDLVQCKYARNCHTKLVYHEPK